MSFCIVHITCLYALCICLYYKIGVVCFWRGLHIAFAVWFLKGCYIYCKLRLLYNVQYTCWSSVKVSQHAKKLPFRSQEKGWILYCMAGTTCLKCFCSVRLTSCGYLLMTAVSHAAAVWKHCFLDLSHVVSQCWALVLCSQAQMHDLSKGSLHSIYTGLVPRVIC